ncbi:hypothetical protein G5C51_10455 [Streptomyces sp. A7024]|uniref:Secreted protein n=1 Tax=Streptomyces coryli TaxID=1128680 RepID=A0A6G4TWY0_9ACTN|nr:hypothetical protein [Streptomyces coryli]NGN64323.1 hypothetical protein [Streptomyces coryli]
MKRPLIAGAVCLATTTALLLTGAAPQAASDDLCDNLTELRLDSLALGDLSSDSSKDDVKESYDDVQDDWEDVRDDLGEVNSNARDAVQKAADDLRNTYADLPDDASVREIVSTLRPEARQLGQELRDAASDVRC